jgi:hypothetical protein
MNRLVWPDGFGAWRSTTLPTNPERFWRGAFVDVVASVTTTRAQHGWAEWGCRQ